MNAYTSHLKNKDHLLRRSEELLAEHANASTRAGGGVICSKAQARQELKKRQYDKKLQLWIERGEG